MISIHNLHIPDYQAISLDIANGECIGISGASGSGKTRLLRALADMDEHTGDVSVNGVAAASVVASEWRKKVALLPAESVWWFDRIGEHFQCYNAYFPALGFSEEVMQWESARCSSGEKQRLSIIRALESEPEFLLLDEPTANLDKANTASVEAMIKQYIQENAAAAIWVGHSLPQLDRVADRQFQMMDGRLLSATGQLKKQTSSQLTSAGLSDE